MKDFKNDYSQCSWEFLANRHKTYSVVLMKDKNLSDALRSYLVKGIEEIEKKYPCLIGATYED